jgi:hypothetical protein
VSGGVLARAEAWLFEPAPARAVAVERPVPPAPVVAVIGLARCCGATTLARALGVELARRHHSGVAIVSATALPHGSLATGAARRLARRLGLDAQACGRLALCAGDATCFAHELPLVLDVGHGTPPEAALALADRALLVAAPGVEPALADVAVRSLARDGLPPLVVLNRADEDDSWGHLPDIRVGQTRLGARLAAAGRDPVGALGGAAARLADACEAVHA